MQPCDVTLRLLSAEELDVLRRPWNDLYQHQADHGMKLQLPVDAFDKWVLSISPVLGRFAMVVVAECQSEVIGFVAGRIRTLPPYFGSIPVGAVSEVFVAEPYRGKSLGEVLLQFALSWYQKQGIERVELQVVAGNHGGLRFYHRLGWHTELVQMIWQSGNDAPGACASLN